MVLTKITRSKSFEMVNGFGLKSWDKFGLEADLSPNEDPIQLYKELDSIIDQAHKESYPDVPIYEDAQVPEKQVDKPTDKIQGWIQVIELTDNLNSLGRFKNSVDNVNDPKLNEAYNKQLEKLTNKK